MEPKIAGNPYETRAMIGRSAPAKGKKKGKAKKKGGGKGKKSGDGFGGCKFGC